MKVRTAAMSCAAIPLAVTAVIRGCRRDRRNAGQQLTNVQSDAGCSKNANGPYCTDSMEHKDIVAHHVPIKDPPPPAGTPPASPSAATMIDLYKLEYTTGATRYENIYKARLAEL